jgi:hypothetical protein
MTYWSESIEGLRLKGNLFIKLNLDEMLLKMELGQGTWEDFFAALAHSGLPWEKTRAKIEEFVDRTAKDTSSQLRRPVMFTPLDDPKVIAQKLKVYAGLPIS